MDGFGQALFSRWDGDYGDAYSALFDECKNTPAASLATVAYKVNDEMISDMLNEAIESAKEDLR